MAGFGRAREGGAATLVAMFLPVILGVGALALDLGHLYYVKARVQLAADSAALGGALLLPATDAVAAKALELVAANTPGTFGRLSQSQDVALGTWDPATKAFAPTTTNPNAVRVQTHRSAAYGNPVATFIARFAGIRSFEVHGSAVAVKVGEACVVVLDPSSVGALSASGTGRLAMNCPLQVNSTAAQAGRATGSSSIASTFTCIVGGYSGTGWQPLPKTGCEPGRDPLAALPEPPAPASNCTPPAGSGTMRANCVYTGSLSLSGNVTLEPGIVYLRNAQLKVSSNTSLIGSNVLIFLDENSRLELGGGGTIDLSAATTGTYAGILVFQSRRAPASTALTLGGNGPVLLNGTLYAPSATLAMTGNSTYTASIGYAVAYRMTLSGSANFVFNAFPAGAKPRAMTSHSSLVR